MTHLPYRLAATALNVAIPGSGCALIGGWQKAWTTTAILLSTLFVMSWLRSFFEPWGLPLYVALAAITILLSSATCWTSRVIPLCSYRHNLLVILFVLLNATTSYLLFQHKDRVLGMQIYFVPSMSMYPTLRPGEFILADTWVYDDRRPELGDIVVFKDVSRDVSLVKRVALWPNGKVHHQDRFYVLGDNPRHSQDSRHFGGVDASRLEGKAHLVLARVDSELNIHEPILQSIANTQAPTAAEVDVSGAIDFPGPAGAAIFRYPSDHPAPPRRP